MIIHFQDHLPAICIMLNSHKTKCYSLIYSNTATNYMVGTAVGAGGTSMSTADTGPCPQEACACALKCSPVLPLLGNSCLFTSTSMARASLTSVMQDQRFFPTKHYAYGYHEVVIKDKNLSVDLLHQPVNPLMRTECMLFILVTLAMAEPIPDTQMYLTGTVQILCQ